MHHPTVWEYALKEAFLLLGAQPPNIAVMKQEVKVKKHANDLPVAFLRQNGDQSSNGKPTAQGSSRETDEMMGTTRDSGISPTMRVGSPSPSYSLR
jgi:hypothetical protein